MNDLLSYSPIVTVAEVRKIADSISKGCLDDKTDDEVEQYITQLDFLAELFLKGKIARKEAAHTKRD